MINDKEFHKKIDVGQSICQCGKSIQLKKIKNLEINSILCIFAVCALTISTAIHPSIKAFAVSLYALAFLALAANSVHYLSIIWKVR